MKLFIVLFALMFGAIQLHMSNACAQWVQTNGPYGGEINCFTHLGSDIYAGTSQEGVFRSTDNGHTWLATGTMAYPDITTLASSGTMLFAGTYGGGMFRSTDSGKSWNPAAVGLPENMWVTGLASSDANVLVLGYQGQGMFMSRDSGITWDSVQLQVIGAITPFVACGTHLFVGMNGYSGAGLYESTDGMTWNLAHGGLPSSDYDIVALASHGADLYAAGDSVLYLSSDSGMTWRAVGTNPTKRWLASLAVVGGKLYASGYIPSGASYIACSFVSADSGRTWTTMANLETPYPFVAFTAAGNAVLAASFGNGVFRSMDGGGSWEASSQGLPNPAITALTRMGSTVFAGTRRGGVYRSTDSGATWTIQNIGLMDGNIYDLSAMGPNLFASTENGLWRSTDSGARWAATSGYWQGSRPEAFVTQGTNLFADNYRSTDEGATWSRRDTGSTYIDIRAMAVNGPDLLAGGYGGIYRSSDSGISWCPTALSHPGSAELEIDALTTIGTNIFAGSENEASIYRSTNGGTDWTNASNGIFNNTAVLSLASVNGNLVAGANGGIFLSTDSATNWSRADWGTPANTFTTALTVLDADNTDALIFAGTAGSFVYKDNGLDAANGTGVWRRSLPNLLEDAGIAARTQENVLAIQAYPNPCESSTTIRFNTPEQTTVEVRIVNVLGSQVAMLYSGTLAEGNHVFRWDARNVPAGAYFCQVRSAGHSDIVGTIERE